MEPSPQERLWQALSCIPEGQVIAYGSLAVMAGLPGRARWVGRTLAALPSDTRLPWHRVINAAGRISFAPGTEAFEHQRSRLEAEGIVVRDDGRVDKRTFMTGL